MSGCIGGGPSSPGVASTSPSSSSSSSSTGANAQAATTVSGDTITITGTKTDQSNDQLSGEFELKNGEVTGDVAEAGVYIFSTSFSAYAGGEATLAQ